MFACGPAIYTPTGYLNLTDPDFASVKLLLHCDGANGSTTFTDHSSSARVVTPVANAQISTAQSMFGGSSGYFDGTGDYLSIPASADWALPTTAWTWELWYYVVSLPGGGTSELFHCDAVTSASGFRMTIQSSAVDMQFRNGAGASSGATHTAGLNTWRHVAWCCDGLGNTRCFLNGALGSTVASDNAPSAGVPLLFGRRSNGTEEFNGYMEEARFTPGVARYTSAFTVPSGPFPNSA